MDIEVFANQVSELMDAGRGKDGLRMVKDAYNTYPSHTTYLLELELQCLKTINDSRYKSVLQKLLPLMLEWNCTATYIIAWTEGEAYEHCLAKFEVALEDARGTKDEKLIQQMTKIIEDGKKIKAEKEKRRKEVDDSFKPSLPKLGELKGTTQRRNNSGKRKGKQKGKRGGSGGGGGRGRGRGGGGDESGDGGGSGDESGDGSGNEGGSGGGADVDALKKAEMAKGKEKVKMEGEDKLSHGGGGAVPRC